MLKSVYPSPFPCRAPRIAACHFYTHPSSTTAIQHKERNHSRPLLSTGEGMPTPTPSDFHFASTDARTWCHSSNMLPLVNNRRDVYEFHAVASRRRFGSESRGAPTKITTSDGNPTEKSRTHMQQKNARDSACTKEQLDTFFADTTDKRPSSVKSFKAISIANSKEKSGGEQQNAPDPTDLARETEKIPRSIKSKNIGIDDVDEGYGSEQHDPLESSSASTTTTTPETDSSQTLPTDEIVRSQTMDWIHKVVIGYNLCPFAEKPIRLNIFTSTVVRGADEESILSAVLREMDSRTRRPGATLVLCPDYAPDDFETFMSLMNRLEEDGPGRKDEFRGKLSAVPFHPLYEFEPQEEYGNDADSVENYVYRSPHPMILILRKTEVERALEKLEGDISDVSYRNLVLLKSAEERMGREKFVKAMRGEYVREMDVLMSYWKYIGYHDDPQKFKGG